MCEYILGLRSVAYCFWVTLTLASGLGFRKYEENECPELSNNFPQMSCIRHITVTYPVYYRLKPQSHTHLRTLRMVRKASLQLSVHSVTICITSSEYVTVLILSATYRKAFSIRAQILKNNKKSSADETNAMIRNATQGYVINRIVFVSHPHLIRI